MSSMKDAREAIMVGRRTDGTRVNRPLSPHLQVYDMLQITSGLSIAHRATGVAWSVGLLVLAWWLLAAAAGPGPFATVQWFLSSFLGMLMLFGMTAVAWYHTLAGLRHLMWDAGYGFDLPTTYRTGRAVLIGTGVLTVLTWLIVIIAWG
ncbi:succinate dehydrogenase, cytochrome b556 subunit [Teichococcus cervicalis]|uniref:Succinate dehydrogenase cytochrome b556 subunit n=1 Tax=Pseudoroseomonas cervicalis ATCC 49957 TaxID=525371 RepID=D5RI48_9PROT|nr:succinate dehydrogenase, cytochrome b556 subunit [Pseudoroseomonas cervicalis]EFH13015.1 succinate dehydrogenase, cytochrome b556 subunit [Pseudoroseomonas cervicalis ATCC 49957]